MNYEGHTFGFIDHDPAEHNRNQAASAPNKKDLGLKICMVGIDKVGGGVGNSKVEQPVCSRGDRQGLGTHFKREQFAGYYPRDDAPAGCEEEDVEADERNSRLLSTGVAGV